jgi:hypothetical protein
MERRKPVSSDGLVPVASQKWKPSLRAATGTTKNISQKEFPFPVDRLNQCNWWDGRERHVFSILASPYIKSKPFIWKSSGASGIYKIFRI